MNFPVVKAVPREIEPLAFNALRFPCAALAIWVLLKAQGRRLTPARKDWRTVIALGTIGHIVFQVCFIYGLDLTLTGNAALLLSTVPVWVLLISAAVGWEALQHVDPGRHPGHAGGDGDPRHRGVARNGGRPHRRPACSGRGVLEMTAWTLWTGLPFIVLMGIPDLLRTDWAAVSAGAWLGVVYAGVFAIAVAYLLWYRGVRAIGQSRTSVYQNLVPVIALAGAWLWLEEMPTPQQLIGAAVILAGVVVARRSPRR